MKKITSTIVILTMLVGSAGAETEVVAQPIASPETQETIQEWDPNPGYDVLFQEAYRYATCYYYEYENLLRYWQYEHESGLPVDEVVWRVNMNQDLDPYENPEPVKNPDDLGAIVNKRYKLPDDYVPENLVKLSSGHYVTYDTKLAYEAMAQDATSEGYQLRVASAYRSISYQTSLYHRYLRSDPIEVVDTYSARPCYSEHHTGRAIDLLGSFGSMTQFGQTPEADWVGENCHKYGFIISYTEENREITNYQSEPWHIFYVGTEHSEKMHQLGIQSWAEYVAKYVEHTPPVEEENTEEIPDQETPVQVEETIS